MKTPIDTDDNCDGHSRFRSSNRNNKECEEYSFGFCRKQELIEGKEIDVDAIQNKLNGNQHGDHISSRDESKNPDEKQGDSDKEIMIK